MPAASRTVRVTTPSIVPPAQASPISGPWLTRARFGLSPTRPHSLAGMRIDPPPSLACAAGTMPLATAAADPPPGIPGVAGRGEVAGLGGHRGAHLRHVRAAERHEAGRPERLREV